VLVSAEDSRQFWSRMKSAGTESADTKGSDTSGTSTNRDSTEKARPELRLVCTKPARNVGQNARTSPILEMYLMGDLLVSDTRY
jgi:hypothetical protein